MFPEADARTAWCGGDDTTDLDALDGLVADGRLDAAARSACAPPWARRGMVARADVVVDGMEDFAHVVGGLVDVPVRDASGRG